MSNNILKVPFNELEINNDDIFINVTYKGKCFTGIGIEENNGLHSEYAYKNGMGHGKCFTVNDNGQKIEEFELYEGKEINSGYYWYPNGILRQYTRFTPCYLTRKWSEKGILILEDDEEAKIRKEYYLSGELKCEYKKYLECICYAKNGEWIYKEKYVNGTLDMNKKFILFNDSYINENYYDILFENSIEKYIFLWLNDILENDRSKAIEIICNLINHENMYVKIEAIYIAGENKINEARYLLEKMLTDERIPPSQVDPVNGRMRGYASSISWQAKKALSKLV